jgi:DNA-binding NarL/FixJ family response regulator
MKMLEATPVVPAIRILVVDDHPLLRAGLAEAIASQSDMEISGEACNGLEAVERFFEVRPDVTVMDIAMPEMCGVTAMQEIRRQVPDARFVILTTFKGDAQIQRAAQAGAMGFLLKSTLRKDLLETIRDVHSGQRRVPLEIAKELTQYMGHSSLSVREMEVLQLTAGGNSNKRIALKLEISEETVKAHMKNIFTKLMANDRTHAVTIALRRGIINL